MNRLGTTLLIALSLTLSIAAAPLAAAQGQGGPPPGRPAGGPPGGGAGGAGGGGAGGAAGTGRGDRIFDVTETVARLMEADLDKDGKLSKEEAPAPFASRGFERADSNADGFVDRAELTVFFSAQGENAPPARGEGRGEGRAGGRGGQQQSFGGGMKQSGRAWNALKKSAFDAASKPSDLEQVQALQSGLLASKGQLASVKMSAAAKKKFGDDQAAYAIAFRRHLLKTIGESVALELALLDGDAAAARAAMGRLDKEQDAGHELFASEEEGEEHDEPAKPASAPPARGAGGR